MRLDVLLLERLLRHEPHVPLLCSRADRLGVVGIVFCRRTNTAVHDPVGRIYLSPYDRLKVGKKLLRSAQRGVIWRIRCQWSRLPRDNLKSG